MNIEEYRSNLHEEMAIAANAEATNVSDEFLEYATGILITGEEFDDFSICYYEGLNRKKAKMRIDGYSVDETDGTCCVFAVDYHGPNESDKILADDINTIFKRMRCFVEESISYKFYEELEEASDAYGFAEYLYNNIDSITKFRFFLLTDAYNRQKKKNIKDGVINERPVELNVWDVERIFDIVSSTTQKENVEIELNNYGIRGIPCVKGTECIDAIADIEIPLSDDQNETDNKTPNNRITYTSYLATVPGKVLCDLYLEYGARLLEGNVRSFLSVKGKVNRSIQATIKNYPEMFFAYNNGIAATATEVKTELTENGLFITEIKNLQIVNGGQTTASIANSVINAKKDEVVDLSNLRVPMKLSVLDYSMSERIIPKISEYSNSQNKVDASDFFSNHPFHVRMEDYSRKTPAPAINGNQYQQYWYYERARGQYNQSMMKLSVSQVKKFKLRYPENQVIKMIELAKYMEILFCSPHIVSKGKQSIVKVFAPYIKDQWQKNDEQFNVNYYKRVVAIAIMFKSTDTIIKNSQEYKYGNRNSYKANVVAYTLSIIFYYIQNKEKTKNFDFNKIWLSQGLYSELEEQISVLWPEVYDFITNEDRPVQNVTEWCKKTECWDKAKEEKWTITASFLSTLISKEDAKVEEREARDERKIKNEIDDFKFILSSGGKYWEKLLEWGTSRKLLYQAEQDIIRIIVKIEMTGVTPSEKQAKIAMKARERLIKEGMPITM